MIEQNKDTADLGEKGTGNFYRVELLDADDFVTFRNHDVGGEGGLERVAAIKKNDDGQEEWHTQAWLIEKNMAKDENGWLQPTHPDAKSLFDSFATKPRHIKGDMYRSRPAT